MTKMNNAACAALLFLAGALSANPQNPASSGAEQVTPFQISVQLNLVVLPVTVRDRKGGFAADLSEKNFEVYENRVRQSIRLFRHEDLQVTVGLVVDHSGSMGNKFADVLA